MKPEILAALDIKITDVRCEHRTGMPMLDIYLRCLPKGAAMKLVEALRAKAPKKEG
jgi:hypothetical protein